METVRSAEATSFRRTLAPGTTVGSYSIVCLIGTGGLGVVYKARHLLLDKPLALKTLHAEFAADANVRERFLREGRAAAKLRHPNVVDVTDVVLEGDFPYLVMELLEGEELTALIARESPLSVQQTTDLLLPVVSALALAHDCGIVHRDLKPQNVFLSHNPTGQIVPKVVDFGISKFLDEKALELTHSRAFLGTPHYMSPEQAQGSGVIDGRSDQFSLGVIAYQCLTGCRPFVGDSLFSLMSAVVNDEPLPVNTLNRNVSTNLAAVISRMLAKAPQERFESIRCVGAALLPFASPRVQLAFEEDFRNALVSRRDSSETTLLAIDSTDFSPRRSWEIGKESSPSRARSAVLTLVGLVACALVSVWLLVLASRNTNDSTSLPSVELLARQRATGAPSEPARVTPDVGEERRGVDQHFRRDGVDAPDAGGATSMIRPAIAQSPKADARRATSPAKRNSKPTIRETGSNAEPSTPSTNAQPERGTNGALILP